jgi:hypothetical protein
MLMACSSAPEGPAALPDDTDSGASPDAVSHMDATTSADAAPDSTPAVCVGKEDPSWSFAGRAPAPLHQGKCSDAEIDSILESCSLDEGTKKRAQRCAEIKARYPACASCMLTPDTAPVGGPFIEYANEFFIHLNVGGCIARMDGDLSPQGCGAKMSAAENCLIEACHHCATGSSADQLTLFSCALPLATGTSACEPLYTAATACLRGDARLNPCNTERDPNRWVTDTRVAKLFCGI